MNNDFESLMLEKLILDYLKNQSKQGGKKNGKRKS